MEYNGAWGPLARKGGLYLNICVGVLVTPLLTRLVCLLSQGRFEEPVLPWLAYCRDITDIPVHAVKRFPAKCGASDPKLNWEKHPGHLPAPVPKFPFMVNV